MPDNKTTLVEAAKELRNRRQDLVTAENNAERTSTQRPAGKPRIQPGTSLRDALKSEHVGTEGERSFGTPISSENGTTPPPLKDERVETPKGKK